MSLEQWAKRHVANVVDQDGAMTTRIRLICVNDQQCLETWERPFPSPEEWCQEVANMLDQYQQDWPIKTISLMFIAEDKNGAQRAQHPKSVTGRNRDASPEIHKNRDAAALAQGMESNAKTMDKVLASANAQLDRSTAFISTLSEAHTASLAYIRAKNEQEALQAAEVQQQSSWGIDPQLKQMLIDNGPKLLNVIGGFFEEQIIKAKADAARAAAAAAVGSPHAKDTDKRTCSKCSSHNEADARFCKGCGTQFTDEPPKE